ncbi:double-strand break repair protein AddB [Dongia sp.]|uniref:double-strand break repair protein AddB n=1 Tax=Dongia sp. TaxID=1977262 RepID=UPI0037535F48
MSPRQPVYTIPTGVPFADALAAGLIARAGGEPLALSKMTVLLPNRRAARALAEAFLRQAGGSDGVPGGGLLLPRLQPIGEPDEESQSIAEAGVPGIVAAEIPPAIGDLRRRMLLARLIHHAPQARLGAGSGTIAFDQAVRLAAELARLIDQVETERLDFSKVKDLAPADSVYWQLTVQFLDLVQLNWPRILNEEGVLDPPTRRNILLERQCVLWRERPPQDPVIAAGSTGSVPASADLIALVAGLPQGMVVLPGLDRDADDETWKQIAEDQSHPQFGLHQLLNRLETEPKAVALWPSDGFTGAPPLRARLVADALLPAAVTESWDKRAQQTRAAGGEPVVERAWRDVARIDCATEQEEAGVIALLLREAVERPAPERAALVTPDRGLARRVKAELLRWGIAIDDSAGEALRLTPPAAFFLLLAEAAAAQWAPVPLLSLLKHPLASGGLPTPEFRQKVRSLERAILRGARPKPGLAGLRDTIEAARKASTREAERDALRAAQYFVEALTAQAAAFDRLDGPRPIAERLAAQVEVAEALAATDAETGVARLWAGEDGEALADFIQDLLLASRDMPVFDGAGYAALLPELMEGIAVRPRYGQHPRLFIWGPLEARLQQAEFVVLGGLNEGVWPPEPAVDSWLNRPMRRAFGLPAPERRIGLSAHDFQQAMGARQVVLTRALRADGQPTIPARWLLRLEAYLKLLGIDQNLIAASGQSAPVWRGWRQRLDRADMVQPILRPKPMPGAKRRPTGLSVTQIELWMRDPYAIYARHILNLRPLDPIDQDPDFSDLGTIVHQALHRFVSEFPGDLSAEAEARLLEIGRAEFKPYEAKPAVMAFWWPRFEKIARWFVANESALRPGLDESRTELAGSLKLTEVKPAFELTARADRIDRQANGDLVVIDYKTGQPPSSKEVLLGLAPQLALEAAIIQGGAFKDFAKGPVGRLEYWRLSGGATSGEIKPVQGPKKTAIDPEDIAAQARAGLIGLLRAFGQDGAAYPPVPRAEYASRFNDYEHLERIREWSVNQTDEEAGDYG